MKFDMGSLDQSCWRICGQHQRQVTVLSHLALEPALGLDQPLASPASMATLVLLQR